MLQIAIFASICLTVASPASGSDVGGKHVSCNATSTTADGATVSLACQLPDDITKLLPVSISIEQYVNSEIKYNAECQMLKGALAPSCSGDPKLQLQDGHDSKSLQFSIEGLASATEGSFVCKVMSPNLTIPDNNIHPCNLQVLTAIAKTTVAPILEMETKALAADHEQTSSPAAEKGASSTSSNTMAVAIGASVGGAALIIAVVVAIWLIRKRRQAAAGKSETAEDGGAGDNDETGHLTRPSDVENGTKGRMSTEKSENHEESDKLTPSTEEVNDETSPEVAEKEKLLENEEKQSEDIGERASHRDAVQDGGPTQDDADDKETTKHPVPVQPDNSPPPLAAKRSRPAPLNLLSSAGDGQEHNDQSHVEQSGDNAEGPIVRAASPLCKDIKAQQKALEPKVISSIVSRTKPYHEEDIQNEYRRPPRVSEFGRGPPEDAGPFNPGAN